MRLIIFGLIILNAIGAYAYELRCKATALIPGEETIILSDTENPGVFKGAYRAVKNEQVKEFDFFLDANCTFHNEDKRILNCVAEHEDWRESLSVSLSTDTNLNRNDEYLVFKVASNAVKLASKKGYLNFGDGNNPFWDFQYDVDDCTLSP